MKSLIIRFTIQFLVYALMQYIGVRELKDIVSRADDLYISRDTKRAYVHAQIEKLRPELPMYAVNLLTELAVYSFKTETTPRVKV